MPPLALIQSWQKRKPSFAIWPLSAWLPVSDSTAPTLIVEPVGAGMAAATCVQAASPELRVSRPTKRNQDRRTTRDYVLRQGRLPGSFATVFLIARPAGAGRRALGRLCDWSRRAS